MKAPSLFGDPGFYRSLFVIAVPIMLQNFISSLVNMLDTVMIGRLGTVEIAAVGLGNQIFFLYNLILFGICSGGAIFTAQFWGRGDIQGIRKNMGFCVTLTITVAAVYTLGAVFIPDKLIGIYSRDALVIETGAAYLRVLAPSFIPFGITMVLVLTLRSVEKVRLAIAATLIALSMNAVLNYLFIFGAGPVPAMGVRGAALATVISRYAEMLIVVTVSYARRYPPAGSFRELFAFNSAYAWRFFRIALPVIFNETFWSLGVTTQNLIFARTHTEAIAAFNITNTVSQLTWVIFIGLGNGVAVLIGKKIGEGKEQDARDYASRITRFAPLLSVAVALVLIPLSRLLPVVFNVGPGVLSAAYMMFLVLGFMYPFRAFNMSMVVGICRAGGDTVFCVFYDIALMWIAALPLGALASFVFHAPVWLIYLCIMVEEPVKMFLGLWRLKSGKWLHNVTEGI
ncbi:MAG: MATE family efflux transporter [Treponema sp.]|jgi:putative MATE family efflux protein|nr:MATE family efflux transporter [Treponema sp.]